jgi:hypothetical protein
MHDPEIALEDIKEIRPKIKSALATAGQLDEAFGKYEKKALEVKKEAESVMGDYADILKELDPKKFAPFLTLTIKLKTDLHATTWTDFLRHGDPFSKFSIDVSSVIPRKLRAYLLKNRETPGVKKLEAFYKGDLAPLYKKQDALTKEFEAEFDDAGYSIAKDLEYAELIVPVFFRPSEGGWSKEDVALFEEYNDLQYKARQGGTYITTSPTAEKVSAIVAYLKRMEDILDAIEKSVNKRLFGR